MNDRRRRHPDTGPSPSLPALVLWVAVLLSIHPGELRSQQRANPDFDATVPRPAYDPGEGPRILFDNAHHNFHTSNGRYEPFVRLMVADGFRVTSNDAPFSPESLAGHDILVISSARGAPPGRPGETDPAFTPEEVTAVRDWVLAGGGLLLITDHPPAATPPRVLAEQFGITLIDAAPRDTIHFLDGPGALIFSRPHRTLEDHPITRGRDPSERVQRVVTFTGNSIVPPAEAAVLLRLPRTALEGYSRPPAGDTLVSAFVPAVGTAQGVALSHGRGRVVALGEAAAWTSQIFGDGTEATGMDEPGFDNRRFILNTMRWLAGLLPETAPAWPLPDPGYDPALDRPTYSGQRPRVALDAGHDNLFTLDGRFAPLAALLAADGFRAAAHEGPIARAVLDEFDVLVIAGPRASPADCGTAVHWLGHDDCSAARPAFTHEEIAAVGAWVRDGGALLLALDPFPSASAARDLAAALGVEVTGGHAFDWLHQVGSADWVSFHADSATIAEHPITRDVDHVVAFTTTSLSVPEGAIALLTFASPAVEVLPARIRADTIELATLPIAGRAAAVALSHGRGRVAMLGDADLLTSQLFEGAGAPVGLDGPPGHHNRLFTLNLFRWLAGS